MKENWLDIKKELQQTGRVMFENQLSWGNSGNISARVDERHFMISASGTDLGQLDLDAFALCTIHGTGEVIGSRKPSKEVPMHRAIYETRPEIGAVLHSSPFYSTLIASSDMNLKTNCFIESMYYLERIERVPYAHPGSEKLGELVREKAKKANILILEHHGVLVYDTDLKEALVALQTLEMVCRMNILAKASGIHLKELPEEIVQSFLEESGYRPRRKWES